MEEELSMLKKSLISLVVSSPTTMTVSRLLKDYRSMVGGVLPLAKYGYREPVLFLKERCTDIFVIEGPSWDPILTPKVTKNLAHIDQMVQKQKLQSTARHKGKRRSILQPNTGNYSSNRYDSPKRFDPQNKYEPQNRHIQSNDYNNKTNKNDTSNMSEKKIPNSESKTPSKPNEVQAKTVQDMDKENAYNSKHIDNSNVSKTSKDVSSKPPENLSNSVERSSSSQMSALSKFYKKRLPQYNSDMDFPSPDLEQNSKSSAESAGQSSMSSGSKQALLDELKTEIVALIQNSPDGVWCSDLIKLYKETYGRELKFKRFGHTGLINLIYSMDDLVVVSRPKPDSDWLLQHRNSVDAGVKARVGAETSRRVTRHVTTRPTTNDNDDALPGVDFDTDVFPPDSLHYLDSIPGSTLEDAGPGSTLEVLLGEVYSPSHFWMLRVGQQYNQAMELIMDYMNEYYNNEGKGRVLARGALRVGQYCAALFDGDWHRALIVCILDSDTVKVRHVDYGTVDSVSASSLKPLLREWGVLPSQAVRGRLAAVRPAAAGWRWPRAACAAFLHSVREKRLYAHILQINPVDDIVETFLIDTTGERDICLTRELIRVGHADARHDSALQSDDCYLYPRFEALESGATPNYADICRMLADGITLEYVDTYRRHVPGPWARPPAPAPNDLPPQLDLLRLEEDSPSPSPSPSPPPSQPSHPPQAKSPPLASQPPLLSHPSHLSQLPQLVKIAAAVCQPQLSHPPQHSYSPQLPQHSHSPQKSHSPQHSQLQQLSHLPLHSHSPQQSNSQQHSHSPQLPHPPYFSHQPQPSPLPQPSHSPQLSRLPQHSHSPQLSRLPQHSQLAQFSHPPQQAWSYTGDVCEPGMTSWTAGACVNEADGSLEVRLSAAEWAVLSRLRGADPAAAHWYLLSSACRALMPQPPPGL